MVVLCLDDGAWGGGVCGGGLQEAAGTVSNWSKRSGQMRRLYGTVKETPGVHAKL